MLSRNCCNSRYKTTAGRTLLQEEANPQHPKGLLQLTHSWQQNTNSTDCGMLCAAYSTHTAMQQK
jgi:hypothetical protein